MSGLTKFGSNPWGITNKEGMQVTTAYLKRYVECACRKPDGFRLENVEQSESLRTRLFRIFMSTEFLAPLAAQHLNSCQIGDAAAIDPRWVEAGCSPQYSEAQKRRIAARGNGNIVSRLNTPEGRQAVADAREREIELREKEAKAARIHAIRHVIDPKITKMWLKMDESQLPEDMAKAVRLFKEDYASMMAETTK